MFPFDGSGGFTRDNGTHSGTTVWADDAAADLDIDENLHDAHDEDIAQGLSNTICKDGQTTPTADIPFGGYKPKNIGAATLRTDAARASQVQDGAFLFAGTSAGTGNDYTASLSPAPSAPVSGMVVWFIADKTNSGAATFDLNGTGAVAIKKGASGVALIANDIRAGGCIGLVYNATAGVWYLISPAYHANIDALAGLAVTDGVFYVGNGTEIVAESGAIARASMSAAVLGANDDITALNGISLSSWTPTVSASGSMSVSSLAINEAKYQIIGGYLEFHVSLNATLGGTAAPYVYITAPVAGDAMDINCTFALAATENGSAIADPRWQYDSGSNRFTVFKPGLSNFTLGANFSAHIMGRYAV